MFPYLSCDIKHFFDPPKRVGIWTYKFTLVRLISYFDPILPKIWPLCNFRILWNLFMPCKVQFWYCFVCATICSVYVWIFNVPNSKLTSKFTMLYFWPPFCPKMAFFCNFQSLWNLFVPCKVHFCYSFIRATICSVYLCIFNAPNDKLTSKFMILHFWPSFYLNLASFAPSSASATYLCLLMCIF